MDRVARTGSDKAGAGRPGRRLGSLVAAVGLALGVIAPAHAANIVTNGSFETGDFTGWTQGGNSGFTGVTCPGGAPDGNCFAFAGPVGSNGTLAQTLTTLPGRFYTISFAWEGDGGSPSVFSATWDGITLLNLNPAPATPGFVTRTFLEPATAASTTLTFTFRDDPGFIGLDAVAAAVPEPASVALLGIGLAGLWAGRRRKAQ